MILERINSPQDIKRLNPEELKILSLELRDYMVKVVAKNGGHLASSLGAVELTVALHICLESPKDKIIFDVGHQCYAHKLLTGRRTQFEHLRQYKGLSGFPNPAESEHDAFISGHASCSISWAQGLAEANKLNNSDGKVVAIIGDGSLSGGMAFEALNSSGHSGSDMLVIYNHNEMSISSSVGALSKYFNKIISAPAYNRARIELERFLEKHSLAKKVARHAKRFEEALKGLMVPGLFFEELGFRYFGPYDGHNLETLVPTLKNILPLKGPKVLHIVTQKGKGYKFAEEDPERFHGASPFDVATGIALKAAAPSFGDCMARNLTELAKNDKRIVAITAAMPSGTGLDIFAKEHPGRFYDVGIAEEHAVGLAAGLARNGLRPVIALYSTFLQRSFDQIIHDVALQNLPVIFAIDRAGVVGEDGPTHHGVFDISYLRMIPNMVVMAPKDKAELEEMLRFALTLDKPSAIRYPRGSAGELGNAAPVVLGKAQMIKKGKGVCLLSMGTMFGYVFSAAEELAKDGIDATIINARFAKPLDEELLLSLEQEHDLLVTVEDNALAGGFGSAVLECLAQNDMLHRLTVLPLGFKDEFIPSASREELFAMYGLHGLTIARRVKAALQNKHKV